MRADYPVLRDEVLKAVAFNSSLEPCATSDEVIWRFIDENRHFGGSLSVTSTFLTLKTRKYASRADFIERLDKVLTALYQTLKPTHVTRVGVRYIDQVTTMGFSWRCFETR